MEIWTQCGTYGKDEQHGDMVQIQQNTYGKIWLFIGCNGKLIGMSIFQWILFERQ